MGREHHALPDGFADCLDHMADRIEELDPRDYSFEDDKRDIARKLLVMAQFPHSIGE